MDDRTTRITTIRKMVADMPLGTECLVVIYGSGIGRKYDLFEEEVTIGRDPENTIVLNSDAVSRRHARVEKVGDARYVTDLDSTNGTYINDIPIRRARLPSGAFLKIGDTIFKYLTGDDLEAAYYEEIHRMAVTDGLTQAANKRAMDEFLEREMSRARRYNRNLAVLMMDIDHFKAVNDTHGHLIGDQVLRELVAVIRPRIRREELFARYGGEEFVVILPEADIQSARELAATLRALIEDHLIVLEGRTLRITVSIGVGQFQPDVHRSPQDLLKEADRNLYAAKAAGRNRVHG